MPYISYDHDNFPANVLPSYERRLEVTWDELVWAAVTVGRPDLYHVFRHGNSPIYEAIFRWSMIRMALEQRGPYGRRFFRTDAFKHMDPTEKGAVNYFLGLVICKLFSAKRLDAPWTLHLDIWKDRLGANLLGGRSRPDMIAQAASSAQWHAFECKGRASTPGEAEKLKAKNQAMRVVSVSGTECTLHIGSIAYFSGDALQFYWRDPTPVAREPIKIPRPEDAWREYYQPFVEAYRFYGGQPERALAPEAGVAAAELDLTLKMHPTIGEYLLASNWQGARRVAREMRAELKNKGYQSDGLQVVAGRSWYAGEDRKIKRQ